MQNNPYLSAPKTNVMGPDPRSWDKFQKVKEH